MTYQSYISDMTNLPDPIHQPEFYAGVPTKRLLAWVVDTVIILFLCALTIPFTLFLSLFFLPVLYLVIGFAYRVVTLARGSATWGMRLAAIEMRTAEGNRFDLQAAFWHTLGFTMSMAFSILQVISIVLMLTSSRGQGLTDHVMGTTALNLRR